VRQCFALLDAPSTATDEKKHAEEEKARKLQRKSFVGYITAVHLGEHSTNTDYRGPAFKNLLPPTKLNNSPALLFALLPVSADGLVDCSAEALDRVADCATGQLRSVFAGVVALHEEKNAWLGSSQELSDQLEALGVNFDRLCQVAAAFVPEIADMNFEDKLIRKLARTNTVTQGAAWENLSADAKRSARADATVGWANLEVRCQFFKDQPQHLLDFVRNSAPHNKHTVAHQFAMAVSASQVDWDNHTQGQKFPSTPGFALGLSLVTAFRRVQHNSASNT
jgi:hypothetical protein